MPKVLISDKLSTQAKEIFDNNGIVADVKTGLTPEQLSEIIGEYDGLAIRSSTKVTKEILAKASKLKVVGRAGIGVDNVDIPSATAKGVVVMNTPFGNSITTAEHAIAMMFSVARQLPVASASTHAGKWEKNRFMGTELAFKTLGLIGCGNIGSIVADRAQGLKMRVAVYDPYLSDQKAADMNVEKVTLEDLLKRADFISLHTPLNDQTRNILSKENLSKTKKGVIIINCARGGLVDESALAELIKSGHIAGAGFDVFEKEPATENPLFGLEQVVCTPHLGASTTEAQENVAVQVAEQICDFLNKGSITNAVNVASVSAEDAAKLSPYVKLGEALGKLAGQIVEGGINKVNIDFEGNASTLNTKPIISIILKGILENIVETVNVVNAPVIAKERNIKVSESKSPSNNHYDTLISVLVESDKGSFTFKGTIFNNNPRIVQLGEVTLEASLNNNMLYIENEDKPGLIGGIGKVLGDEKVNIANFNLGRNESKKNVAVALVSVDSEVSNEVVKKLSSLPSVIKVRVLKF
ncbi:MAG: phosphoglycerate dehydrogenase [Rickettsiales bacterium]|nr:phosphoglycerate dehydrogenase [Rickettsiales bacterium]